MEPPYTTAPQTFLDQRYTSKLAHHIEGLISTLRLLTSTTKKPEISIHIDNHYAAKTYTSEDLIRGEVTLQPKRDLTFHELQITLFGVATVDRDDIDMSLVTTHLFLSVVFPLAEGTLPSNGVLVKGETYEIPFDFRLPCGLTSGACSHSVQSPTVTQLHQCLPPSMGTWEGDQTTPRGVRVKYGIKASAIAPADEPASREILANVIHHFNFKPRHSACFQPTLPRETLQKVTFPRNNMSFRAKGRIIATVTEPEAAVLDISERNGTMSMIPIQLTLEAQNQPSALPSVIVSAKLEAKTWSCSRPRTALPNSKAPQDAFCSRMVLIKPCIVPVAWSSDYDEDSEHEPRTLASTETYHAALQIPFQVPPTQRDLIPTFHTCLISRTYHIKLKLKIMGLKLKMNIPLKILCGNVSDPSPSLHFDIGDSLQRNELDRLQSSDSQILPDYSD
ncbi:hypothetical protein LCI18_009485 [Fusarium solani-melongenae]|uniref:Uncharacterized protein n=1 Tax=Fusarium solani subsp. cucurbitae TaxID=2747967 RepID=A0ACD3ZBG1_FUSSC|nr:hypothetical protein LCI18_009485 [Fusarium solani-melongenae]